VGGGTGGGEAAATVATARAAARGCCPCRAKAPTGQHTSKDGKGEAGG
jgi:hypothetical protein